VEVAAVDEEEEITRATMDTADPQDRALLDEARVAVDQEIEWELPGENFGVVTCTKT
jgi:hypothetical protein